MKKIIDLAIIFSIFITCGICLSGCGETQPDQIDDFEISEEDEIWDLPPLAMVNAQIYILDDGKSYKKDLSELKKLV